jgi:dynein assembly factor 3
VHLKQYRAWRKTGLAYEFGDQVYNEPNRTMISYAEGIVGAGTDRGYRKQVRGFWLDVRCGPFSSFAVDCDKPNKAAKDLFEIHSKGTGAEQQRHHAVEIAVYNMLSYLWEIETETVYLMTRPHEIYSGLGATEAPPEPQPEEIFGADVQEEADRQEGIPAAAQGAVAQEGSSEELAFERARHILQSLQGVKIFLLGGDWSHDHCGRARHSGRKFDAVCISATAAQLLGKEASADLCGMLANEATISVDTAKYLLPLGKDLQHEWNERIRVMASEQGFEPLEPLGMDDTAGENSSNHCEPQLLFSHHAPPPSS